MYTATKNPKFLAVTLTALSLVASVSSEVDTSFSRRSRGIWNHRRGDKGYHDYGNKYTNSRFTFYDAGQNACGSWDSNNDHIVALNSAQFDGGSHCYQQITISYGGKQTTAMITDECPGCPWGGLDFSRGLFDFFASESMGVLYGNWDFGSGGSGGSGSSPPPAPPPPPPPAPKNDYKAPSPTTPAWKASVTKAAAAAPPPPPAPPSPMTTYKALDFHPVGTPVFDLGLPSLAPTASGSAFNTSGPTLVTPTASSGLFAQGANAATPAGSASTPTAAPHAHSKQHILERLNLIIVRMGALADTARQIG